MVARWWWWLGLGSGALCCGGRVRVRCTLLGLLGELGLGLGRGGGTKARWRGVGRLAGRGVHHGCCGGARGTRCACREEHLGAQCTQCGCTLSPPRACTLWRGYEECERLRGGDTAWWGRLRRRRMRRCDPPLSCSLGRCVPNHGCIGEWGGARPVLSGQQGWQGTGVTRTQRPCTKRMWFKRFAACHHDRSSSPSRWFELR